MPPYYDRGHYCEPLSRLRSISVTESSGVIQLPKASVSDTFYELQQMSRPSPLTPALKSAHVSVISRERILHVILSAVLLNSLWSSSQMYITADGRGLIFNALSYRAVHARATPSDNPCGYSHLDAFFNRDVRLTCRGQKDNFKKNCSDGHLKGHGWSGHELWQI